MSGLSETAKQQIDRVIEAFAHEMTDKYRTLLVDAHVTRDVFRELLADVLERLAVIVRAVRS